MTRSGAIRRGVLSVACVFASAASALGQAPANDLCDNAELISLTEGCPFCVPLGSNWFVVYGSTRNATVDGSAPGCAGLGNTARGVWYQFVGRGNRVLLSTDTSPQGTLFDTQLTVYCGSSCGDIGCVAFNDDVSDTVAQSEIQFCARDGVTYWVLVNGFSTAIGEFGLVFRELPGTNGQPIPCCDPQPCGDRCTFTIPPGAIPEFGWVPGPTGPIRLDEACVSDGGLTNVNQFNDGCGGLAPPAGEPRRFGTINVGETITGTLWSHGGFRDRDWFLFENLPLGTGAVVGSSLIHYSFASEGPLRPRYYFGGLITDFSDCNPMLGFVFQDLYGCNQAPDSLRVVDGTATGRFGQTPGLTFGFMIFHNSNGAGYPCGTNDRYWLTLHDVKSVGDCPALPIPMNALDEALAPTFSGTANTDGIDHGEPCYDQDPDGPRSPSDPLVQCTSGCDSVQRMAGCGSSPITDDRFLRITPGVPIVGRVTSQYAVAMRDIDYYKFELAQRSAVSLAVDANMPMTALITSNDCTAYAIGYSIAGTRGRCLPQAWIEAGDLVTLDPGTYILTVFATDLFQTVGSGAIFADIRCADPISTYVVSLDAEPLSGCTATCPPGALIENEACVANASLMFDSCTPDNDGCSQAPFTSIELPGSAASACGTLFSTYSPFPDDEFSVDQDYWSFAVSTRSTVTFAAAADGPVRVQLLHVGEDGALCSDGSAPIIAEVDAGSCVAGDEVSIEVGPGRYALAVTPGSVEIGLSFGDYPCGQELHYSLSMTHVPSCCAGNADRIVPGSVNFADVTAVLANFGVIDPSGLAVGDADCNGEVAFTDITVVLANFLAECP